MHHALDMLIGFLVALPIGYWLGVARGNNIIRRAKKLIATRDP